MEFMSNLRQYGVAVRSKDCGACCAQQVLFIVMVLVYMWRECDNIVFEKEMETMQKMDNFCSIDYHRLTKKMQFIFYMRRILAHTCITFAPSNNKQ